MGCGCDDADDEVPELRGDGLAKLLPVSLLLSRLAMLTALEREDGLDDDPAGPCDDDGLLCRLPPKTSCMPSRG